MPPVGITRGGRLASSHRGHVPHRTAHARDCPGVYIHVPIVRRAVPHRDVRGRHAGLGDDEPEAVALADHGTHQQ